MKKHFFNISIPNITKVNKTDKNSILTENITISEKYDGTKLTLIRNFNDFNIDNYEENWVIAYKHQILYSQEFNHLDNSKILTLSLGLSQYKLIHNHIKQIHSKTRNVPPGTEILIEFIQNKLTTTRDYIHKHEMIFISATKLSEIDICGGYINSTIKRNYDPIELEEISEALNLKTPRILFEGKLTDKFDITQFNSVEILLSSQFMNLESEFGDIMEGIVIRYGDNLVKMTQEDQYDKSKRQSRRSFILGTEVIETEYWQIVDTLAKQLTDTTSIQFPNILEGLSYYCFNILSDNELLDLFNNKITSMDFDSKTLEIFLYKCREDIYLNSKFKIHDLLPENNNVLFLGKFRIPTKAHLDIIEQLSQQFNKVIVCLVENSKSDEIKIDKEEKIRIISGLNLKNVVFSNSSTGFLPGIITSSRYKIKAVAAGSDRIEDYRKQLEKFPAIQLLEISRPKENNISATNLIESVINDDLLKIMDMLHPSSLSFVEDIKSRIS